MTVAAHVAIRVLKVLWLTMAFVALYVGLATTATDGRHDGEIVMAYVMLGLSFPSGLVVAAVFSIASYVTWRATGYVVPNTAVPVVASWLALAAAGWFQWFWMAPILLRNAAKRGLGQL